MIARQWRPLLVTIIWLLLCVLAVWFSPRPPAASWPGAPAASGLLRAFGLVADPTLLVVHRPGGLTPDDLAYVGKRLEPLAPGGPGQRYDDPSGETLALTVDARPEDIPRLRALLQDSPAGLTAHVTGVAALSYDAVATWERSRPWVLAAVMGLAALLALLGRLGLVRALVVAAGAGAAGLVTGSLAALFAPPAPLALATVLGAGLAAAGSVRLLLGLPLAMRTTYLRPAAAGPAPAAEASPQEEPPAPAREIGPLARGLIVSGEMTLLEAFVIVAGLAGFLVDYRAGAALLVGVAVATAANLSMTPALVALFTRPRRALPPPGKTLRLWARIGLVLLPLAGLYLLAPAVRPQDLAARRSDAAAGYAQLAVAGAAGRVMPIHLLLQVPGGVLDADEVAAVQGLLADLQGRPALAAVEGEVALPTPPNKPITDTLVEALAPLDEQVAALQETLTAQGTALSGAAAALRDLDLAVNLGPIETTLSEAAAGLDGVTESLSDTRGAYARIPIEFPEVASRIDHVPTLRTMPATLETAIAGLDGVTAKLRAAVTLTQALANDLAHTSAADSIAGVQDQLADVGAALEALVGDAAALRGTLGEIETLLAEAVAAVPPVSQDGAYQLSANLLRIALVPAAGPFAPETQDEARALSPVVEGRLAGGPLAGSVATWGGAPAVAAAQRAQLLPGLLVQGLVVALVALVLASWVATARFGAALLLTVGAVVSAAAGLGVAAAVFREVDAGVLVLAALVLVAVSAGRLIVGRAPALEDLLLALPPLSLLLSGAPALMALGLALSAGLLVNCFLVAPTVVRRPKPPAAGE